MDFIISKKVLDLVEKIVIKYPKTKSNDKLLCLLVWEHQGLKLTLEQRDYFLSYCISPETITRNRRKLEEYKNWLFPLEVKKQRSFLEDMANKEFRKKQNEKD